MMQSIERQSPTPNRLISILPADIYDRLRQNLLPVTLSLSEVVYEPVGRPDYVYFPTGAVVSLLHTMEDGATAELGLTGNDGIVGIALFLGGDTTPTRAVVTNRSRRLQNASQSAFQDVKNAFAVPVRVCERNQS